MTSTTLIEPPSGDPLAELPPLLSIVPTAGPAAFVYVGFGAVLLLLLVPPITLLATLVAVALVVAAAVAALVMVAAAILEAPFLLVRLVRGHPLGHVSLPVLHIRKLKPRRV